MHLHESCHCKTTQAYVSQKHLINIMNTENSQQPVEASPEYTTPVLMRHGTVQALTQSSTSGAGPDGGSVAPNLYTSSVG
jgi:hypothetical protein